MASQHKSQAASKKAAPKHARPSGDDLTEDQLDKVAGGMLPPPSGDDDDIDDQEVERVRRR